MSNNIIMTANVSINPEAETVKVTNPMSGVGDALITACNTGNQHAITALEAAYSGASAEDFSVWTQYITALRYVAIEYGKIADKADATAEELATARARVWEKWQMILVGDKNHKNMFAREHDADTIRVYAYNMATLNVPGLGSVKTTTPEKIFRKMVETFVGLRFRANEALCDEDRDVLFAYLGAQANIKKAQERLNGTEEKAGLIKQLASVKASYTQSIKMLAGFGISEDEAVKNPAVAGLLVDEKELTEAISKANKTIADAGKVIAEKQGRYDAIIATINKIEKI